ncbi:Oidioi.mRNA.OKI2018_I69.XSR.g14732.t1.cds [Oikopleura dioica]|uniref:Oidioi.mRNA.OKI2018_I69.XSR.g14732.t1.cds n=1 Tax=Oikopleura dioica TaxID=34765 RepID=A0ABN7SEP0_OIKDI|nr:Oidioi.mRNA.OKI2018_I69.XSR.g14732.t1.cds [Oikopleura dioica]
MTVCDIFGSGKFQDNCYFFLKQYIGIEYGPAGSKFTSPMFSFVFNLVLVITFAILGMKNRPKWSKKDFMIRSKLDELDEELKLKEKRQATSAIFKEHMFYKEQLKETRLRLKGLKDDHDTLIIKTQEEKLGFESLQRGLSTLDDQFKRFHNQNKQLRSMQGLLEPDLGEEKEEP